MPSMAEAPEAAAKQTPATPSDPAPTTQRRVIRAATLELEDPHPSELRARALTLVEAQGGYLAGSQTFGRDSASQQSEQLELRVPEARFEFTLSELRGLGERLVSEVTSSQDVTDQLVDLGARLRAKRAVETQFIAILETAASVEDALRVQTSLAEVRTEIERLAAQEQQLSHRTAYSSITLSIGLEAPVVAEGELGVLSSFTAAARDSVVVTLGVLKGSIRLIGVALPLVLLLGAPTLVVVRWYRRRKASQPERESTGPATLASR